MIHVGDCLTILPTLEAESVDSIVTDPPYGLGKEPDAMAMLADWLSTGHHDVQGTGFMGKAWDAFVPQPALWRECLRVLKPGGHLLAFAGTRTHDLMTLGLRIAGFEIRDTIMWVYGSGFPKSLDVSKAIDKLAPRAGMFDAFAAHFAERWKSSGLRRADFVPHFPHYKNADSVKAQMSNWKLAKNVPSRQDFEILRGLIGLSDEWETLIARAEAEREVLRTDAGSRLAVAPGQDNDRSAKELAITASATEAARQWEGWGTALKPALEPITVARKPLAGTVAANVLAHGTGALNIDGCRVEADWLAERGETWLRSGKQAEHDGEWQGPSTKVAGSTVADRVSPLGRWPANLIHDGLAEDWARYFYCAKASKADRGADNNHPTVKPTELMRYLCRLVTPPGGVVLDPFMGSGSTGKAAVIEGFQFVGIEMDPHYARIAEARIRATQPGLPLEAA